MTMDPFEQIRQALRDEAVQHEAVEAARADLWAAAAESVAAALTRVQRDALAREAAHADPAAAIASAMRVRPAPERVRAWWDASYEDTCARAAVLTGVDLARASHFVGAALYALHEARADLTTYAVVELTRAALAYDDGRQAARRELAGARG